MPSSRSFYSYVGPEAIRRGALSQPPGARVGSTADLLAYVAQQGGPPTRSEPLTVTFVIDERGCLRIASRHGEHVACAGGEPVLSAGEMTFARDGEQLVVEEVTNQSTGYCPEPASWPAVATALDRAGISGPNSFTREFHFRRCPDCATIHLIKDDLFECAVCATDLPAHWNFGPPRPA